MIELRDVVYCRLGTRDLAGAEWFATNILGLEVSERRRDATYFKSDERAHTLCYFEGDPEDQVTAFELGRGEDLQQAAATLEALNHEVHYGTRQALHGRLSGMTRSSSSSFSAAFRCPNKCTHLSTSADNVRTTSTAKR